ncbi:related to retrograde regulation protein RTG2 [Rhynchosporium graminicola]|uniref:Related to retrograde regulation protein RTG2 n=1 Tax=Rhynchosporium graminicola TaxID=2792576 RepID=A0A1E1KA80_9HELO|nr:related to retrograde regulation protein RTG2 [Rhynchosporium commune]
MPRLNIAIIGAGPAGCMLACLLLQGQTANTPAISLTIFEAETSFNFRAQYGTLEFHPRTGVAALKVAGLYTEFFKYARYDGSALRVKLSALEDGDPEIVRVQLRTMLLAALPEGTVEWGFKLEGVVQEQGAQEGDPLLFLVAIRGGRSRLVALDGGASLGSLDQLYYRHNILQLHKQQLRSPTTKMTTENGGKVITIDNYRAEMSQYSADGPNQLYGLVDMGSNGIRFSISDLSVPRLLHCIYRERAPISLYDALHESTPTSKEFHFSPSIIQRVADTMARFASICESYRVPKDRISVFATEAMRTAENRDEILAAIKKSSGLLVDILSPGMESLFGAMGARSGYTAVDGLFMDLGGGSVQMTYVNSGLEDGYDILAAGAARSLPFGAAKLTLALSVQDTAHATKTELRTRMKDTFDELTHKFPHLKWQSESKEGITIYFCGGGFRGYGSMLMHTDPIQPYPVPAIGGYTVPGNRFVKWQEMLHVNNHEEGKIFGMSKRRREQFPAIGSVVQSLVQAIPKIKQVIFCSGGNREGVLYMKLPPIIRESNPLALLPGGAPNQDPEVLDSIVQTLVTAMPEGYPIIISPEILHFVARNTWQAMGDPDGANSAKALHNPITGMLAGLPGMTHEIRAIIALTMSARWGNDLGPVDQAVHDNLRALVGHETAWWCDYIGTLASFLATIMPALPVGEKSLDEIVRFLAMTSNGLGKKGHHVGIRLKALVSSKAHRGVLIGDLEGMFKKVGKGMPLKWKVEAEVENF